MADDRSPFDVAVVGGGPAGLAAAVALAAAGARVALVAPSPGGGDWRTTALLGGSVDLLRRLGVWPRLSEAAAPLKRMRLVDATSRLIRAPDVTFEAHEIGRDAFGYNVANTALVAALTEAVAARGPAIVRFDGLFVGMIDSADGVTATLSTGDVVTARLLVAADGRGSAVRQAVGIGIRAWSYRQEAMVLNFSHSASHQDISTEFHTETGPFTTVPLGPGRSSLVWMERPDEIARLAGLDDRALAAAIERRSGFTLGTVSVDGPRQRWPMSGFRADTLAKGRVVLVGEAAHGFPPIGAQGFNLTLRDVAALADIVGSAMPANDPLDGVLAARRYGEARRFDVLGRVTGVDVLNRSLLTGLLPVQAARAVGLAIARDIGPVRRLMMTAGLG